MWRSIVLLLGLWPVLLRAQCPTIAQRYQHLTELSALPTPSQIIAEASRLERQSRTCQTITDSVYAKTLHILGRSYWYVGKLDTAIVLTKRAITINRLNRPDVRPANLVHSYYNLGRIYGDKADYYRAIQAFIAAVSIAKQYPEKWASGANAYDEIAYIYYNIGDYEKAVNVAQEGIDMSQRANDPKMTANTLVQQAQALIVLNNLCTANMSLQKALKFARQIGDLGIMANAYSLMADIANRQQLEQKAIQYYRQAFDFNRQANFRYGCFQALKNLGLVYAKKMEQYDKALSIYKQALGYCDDIGGRLTLLNSMGRAQQGLKHYPEALQYYQQALRLIDSSLDSTQFVANPNSRFFKVAAYKEYLLSLIQDKADTWLDYAKVTNNCQRFQYALETYRVADQMIDFMRWEHTGQQSKLYWREKTRGMYERAIETCFRLKNTEQAFRFFEKSRAALLADKLNELGARQQLSPQQAEMEQKLQQRVNSEQAKLAAIKPTDSVAYRTAQRSLDNVQENLDTFRKKLEASNPTYYGYKYDTTITSVANLRSHLTKQKAAYVTYFVGDSSLYVLGVTPDTSTLLRQPIRAYRQTIQPFMKLLGKPEAISNKQDRDQFLALGNGLYSQLLAPLKLPTGSVIVSPDGSIVPFETFSRKATAQDYLVTDYAFSYIYSARLLLKKWEENGVKTNVRRHDFLGIAPVAFAPSLNQVGLPGSEEALNRIAEQFHSPELLTHETATRRAFLTKATEAGVIHLFTHATADSSGQEPTLYFADSTLKLSDLENGALPNAQLVVLAACKTGIGAVQQGEGVFSLARGFAALGVPSVLTTLWSVQDGATYKLTELFYQYIDEGLPKDVALQRAKQDWLKDADQKNQLPTIWAGLIVVGDTEPLTQANYGLWIAVLSLLVLAGFGGWFWRRQKRQPMSSVSFHHSA